MLVWMSVFKICHPLSSKVTGWHWINHRTLEVALSEISGPLQKLINGHSQPNRYRAHSISVGELARDDVLGQWHDFTAWYKTSLIFRSSQMHVSGSQGNSSTYVVHCTCSTVADDNHRQVVCSAVLVISLLIFLYFATNVSFFGAGAIFDGSGSGSDQNVSAPAPAPHPWE